MMDYGEVITKAGQIVWKHKVLWIFGVLASCGQSRGSYNGSGGNSGSGFNPGMGPGNMPSFMTEWGNWFEQNMVMVIIAVCSLALIFTVLSILLGTMGRVGLIRGTYHADQDPAPLLTFGGLWSEGWHYFWRVFGLDLLIGLATFLVIIILIAGPVALGIAGGALGDLSDSDGVMGMAVFSSMGLGFFLICCIFMPLAIAVSLLQQVTYPAIVIEDLGIFAGLKRGMEVLRANVGPIILMALILGVGGGIVSAIVSLPILFAVVPIFFGIVGGEDAIAAGLITGLVCCAVYLPVLIVLQGIITSYIQSAYTLTFLRLTGRPAVAAIQ